MGVAVFATPVESIALGMSLLVEDQSGSDWTRSVGHWLLGHTAIIYRVAATPAGIITSSTLVWLKQAFTWFVAYVG